jgi:hypothetical protein
MRGEAMRDEVNVVKLDDSDFGVVVTSLSDKRNELIREHKPTGIVDEVILKVAHAKRKKERRYYEAR